MMYDKVMYDQVVMIEIKINKKHTNQNDRNRQYKVWKRKCKIKITNCFITSCVC